MIDPNWVYKGTSKVRVHRVDLDAWLADGWSVEPIAAEPAEQPTSKKKGKPTIETSKGAIDA